MKRPKKKTEYDCQHSTAIVEEYQRGGYHASSYGGPIWSTQHPNGPITKAVSFFCPVCKKLLTREDMGLKKL